MRFHPATEVAKRAARETGAIKTLGLEKAVYGADKSEFNGILRLKGAMQRLALYLVGILICIVVGVL